MISLIPYFSTLKKKKNKRKAELYVATQKETAAIIGKLLRMEFHHPLLSIEVVRKDTGGKEDGNESKKECKGLELLINVV